MPNTGFREIAEHLRRLIASNDEGWSAGAALPSESQLSTEWGVARGTIRRALGLLEADNLIEVIPGRGRFVRSKSGTSNRHPGTRIEAAAAALKQEIASRGLSGRLDSEERLATRFGVSSGTMRQALLRLAGEEVVTAVHGRGWFVRDAGQALTRTDEVANRLRAAIKSGALSGGSSLPGEKVLAAEYGVSRITARRALASLENEGLLLKEPGKGRVVASSSTADQGA